MKYTNIKKLLIKFMGGGLINFPTRFLRWVKIDGNAEGDDGDGSGDDSSSDVFFVPATIQPKYFVNEDINDEIIEIKNYTSNGYTVFLYNKEDIISLGIEEEELNTLAQVTISEARDDVGQSRAKGLHIDYTVFENTFILSEMNTNTLSSHVNIYPYDNYARYVVYKISDDIFLILYTYPIG